MAGVPSVSTNNDLLDYSFAFLYLYSHCHKTKLKRFLTGSQPSYVNNNNNNNFIYIAIYTESSISLNNHKLKTIQKKKLKMHKNIIHKKLILSSSEKMRL